jgi:hypothetical protein
MENYYTKAKLLRSIINKLKKEELIKLGEEYNINPLNFEVEDILKDLLVESILDSVLFRK